MLLELYKVSSKGTKPTRWRNETSPHRAPTAVHTALNSQGLWWNNVVEFILDPPVVVMVFLIVCSGRRSLASSFISLIMCLEFLCFCFLVGARQTANSFILLDSESILLWTVLVLPTHQP